MYSNHSLIIRKGKLIQDTNEFVSFSRVFQKDWQKIVLFIEEIEKICTRNSWDIVYVNGKKLSEIQQKESVLECVVNLEELPFRMDKFSGNEGRKKAAVLIQKNVRMYLQKKEFSKIKLII